jgi:hypothetical protein
MPNGQKYEDWLKDREGRKEDEKNEYARLHHGLCTPS